MRALLKGLWEADTWTLRGWLRAVAFAMFAVTIGYVAIGSGSRNGAVGGLAGSVVVLLLALAAQWVAERRGAPERERRRGRRVAESVAQLATVEADRGPHRRCCVRRDKLILGLLSAL